MKIKSEIFQIERISDLTKLEINNLADEYGYQIVIDGMVAKVTEEILELSVEIIKNNEEGIIEECYDVINTSISLMIILYMKDIPEFVNSINKNTSEPVNAISLIEYGRLFNSYTHIDTSFQSKTGLNSEEELQIKLKQLISNIVCFVDISSRIDSLEKLTKIKLDKWESKII